MVSVAADWQGSGGRMRLRAPWSEARTKDKAADSLRTGGGDEGPSKGKRERRARPTGFLPHGLRDPASALDCVAGVSHRRPFRLLANCRMNKTQAVRLRLAVSGSRNALFYEFIWTDTAIEHLDEHEISAEDFEDVVAHPIGVGRSRTAGLPVAFGDTSDG